MHNSLEVFIIFVHHIHSFRVKLFLVEVCEDSGSAETHGAISDRFGIFELPSNICIVSKWNLCWIWLFDCRLNIVICLVDPLAELINVLLSLWIYICLHLIEPIVEHFCLSDLSGAQIDNHVVKNVLDVVGGFGDVGLSLRGLDFCRSLFEFLPCCLFVLKPCLDHLWIVSVTDDGVL